MSNAPSKPVSFSRPKVGYFSNRPRIAGREQFVHVNRLQISYFQRPWKFEAATLVKRKGKRAVAEEQDEQEMEIQSRPIVSEETQEAQYR